MVDLQLKIHIIVACCNNNGIGMKGKLPWHMPNEYQHYSRISAGSPPRGKKNVILMGRKTWQSAEVGCRPYKDRYTFVISKTMKKEKHEDLVPDAVVTTLEELGAVLKSDHWQSKVHEVFCAGGSHVYKLVLNSPYCGEIYRTRIMHDFECDTYFPELDHRFKKLPSNKFLAVPQGVQEENDLKWEVEIFEKNDAA